MLVDPDMQQEQTCQSLLTFVVEGSADSILTSHANGSFSIEQVFIYYSTIMSILSSQLQQSLGVAKDCSKSITTFYKEAINRKLSKVIITVVGISFIYWLANEIDGDIIMYNLIGQMTKFRVA